MKRNLIEVIGLVLSLSVLFSCSKTPVYKSAYQADQMRIDGNNNDWKGKMYSDVKAGMTYGVSNSDEYLFVKMRTLDKNNTQRILMGGLMFFIDTTAKGKAVLTMKFPVAGEMRKTGRSEPPQGDFPTDDEVGMGKRMSVPGKDMINDRFKTGLAKVLLKGFGGLKEEEASLNFTENGIRAIVQINDNDQIIYEAAIPLNMIFSNSASWLSDTTRVFSYGFKTAEMQRAAAGMQPPGGGRGAGGGMGPGGGSMASGGGKRGGGPPGGNNGMSSNNASSEILVKKVRLSSLK